MFTEFTFSYLEYLDYFCRPECKESEKVLDAIEKLQSDSDRDVRYFAGREEEVPYDGRSSHPHDTPILRNTSRESLEEGQGFLGSSPLEGEFAEEQIEAKLLAVETTEEDAGIVSGVHGNSTPEKPRKESDVVGDEQTCEGQRDVEVSSAEVESNAAMEGENDQ